VPLRCSSHLIYRGQIDGTRSAASLSVECILSRNVKTRRQSTLETCIVINTHTHPFNGPLSGTTRVSRYQKDKTNLDFTEARDSEWQWHQLGRMQVCTLLQTDNNTGTPPLSFLQAGCPSCRPTNSIKALKASDECVVTQLRCCCLNVADRSSSAAHGDVVSTVTQCQ